MRHASRSERLAWVAVVFGGWDLIYYLGLRLTTAVPRRSPLPAVMLLERRAARRAAG